MEGREKEMLATFEFNSSDIEELIIEKVKTLIVNPHLKNFEVTKSYSVYTKIYCEVTDIPNEVIKETYEEIKKENTNEETLVQVVS